MNVEHFQTAPIHTYPANARTYDQGWADFHANRKMNRLGSTSYKDGYYDATDDWGPKK